MGFTNGEKETVRIKYYELIKSALAELGEDIEFAAKGSGAKTKVLNLPFVHNEKEGWLEISVIFKGEDYDGYEERESHIINEKSKVEKAKAKAEAKAKKIARDEKIRKEKAEAKAKRKMENVETEGGE